MKKGNNSWERYFHLVSLILFVSIPFGYFLGSLAFVIWFLFCLVWSIKCKSFKFSKALFPLLIFSLFSFASIIWSQDQPQTLYAIGRQLPLVLFPIAGMCIPPMSKEKLMPIFKHFSLFLCVFGVILVGIAVLKYHKYQYNGFLYYHELVSPLKLNAIYVSYFFSIFFLFNLNLIDKKRIKLFPILIILGVFLVMLSSKMMLIVTALLAVIILGFKIKGKFKKLIILGLVIPTIFAVLKYARPIQSRFTTEFNTSFSEILNAETFKKGRVYTGLEARFLQMRISNDIINTPMEYLFGVGLGASKKELKEIHKKLNTPKVFQSYNFHNQYLQVFVELGLFGFVLILLILGIGLKKSFKINFFLPFIIITMTLFISESVIWRQRGIMFFGLMYILLTTVSRTDESKKSISKV